MKKTSKTQMGELLKIHGLNVDKAKNPLAKLYREILVKIRMNPQRWNSLMNRYLQDPRNGIADDNTKRHQARNNLNRQLAHPVMSFKTIMRGIRVLFPLQVKMTFEIEFGFNQTVNVSSIIYRRSTNSNVNAFEPPDEQDDLYDPETPDEEEEESHVE